MAVRAPEQEGEPERIVREGSLPADRPSDRRRLRDHGSPRGQVPHRRRRIRLPGCARRAPTRLDRAGTGGPAVHQREHRHAQKGQGPRSRVTPSGRDAGGRAGERANRPPIRRLGVKVLDHLLDVGPAHRALVPAGFQYPRADEAAHDVTGLSVDDGGVPFGRQAHDASQDLVLLGGHVLRDRAYRVGVEVVQILRELRFVDRGQIRGVVAAAVADLGPLSLPRGADRLPGVQVIQPGVLGVEVRIDRHQLDHQIVEGRGEVESHRDPAAVARKLQPLDALVDGMLRKRPGHDLQGRAEGSEPGLRTRQLHVLSNHGPFRNKA
mmetsp:Transcript_22020/g.52408  ORF Transcript_22020/g.52408 Transcript_22020/m.52408 type:complete len:323 (+) Transcript_22020:1547-2515(+)